MVTNRVYVNNKGMGRDIAFFELDKFSEYLKLSRKSKLHLCLLTEELLGMVSQIGGNFDAEFWVESSGNLCRLCLEAEINNMSIQKREELLKSSTTGKNAAVKGFMGKLKDIMEIYWLGYKDTAEISSDHGFLQNANMPMNSLSSTSGSVTNWVLSDYKNQIQSKKDSSCVEEWDELERSIVANIADDVSVGIVGDHVEFVITKKYDRNIIVLLAGG